MTFFGTQPTLTQVPPSGPCSDDRHFGAVLRCPAGVRHAAAAAADDKQIVFFGQRYSPLQRLLQRGQSPVLQKGSDPCKRRDYARVAAMTNPLLDTSSLPRFTEITPEHVLPALSELIAAHRQKLHDLLAATPAPDFDSLVAPLEEMDHELSRVWSPVSHLQGVLGSGEWRDAYNSALPLLTEHGTELSQNVPSAAGVCGGRQGIE